jgi:hypothetical protein
MNLFLRSYYTLYLKTVGFTLIRYMIELCALHLGSKRPLHLRVSDAFNNTGPTLSRSKWRSNNTSSEGKVLALQLLEQLNLHRTSQMKSALLLPL